MLRGFRCGSDQCILADFTNFHHIVGNQTVSSFDQFQRGLGFTYAAVPCEQEPDPVDVHKNSVDGNRGCQPDIEPADHLRHKRAGRLTGQEHRHPGFQGSLQDHLVRGQVTCKNNCGNVQGKELPEDTPLVLVIHLIDIGVLHQPDDLDPARGKMVKIPRQLQSRPVDLRLIDISA